MSPEQAAGTPVDPRADIFSTGIVLWELTCARALFGNLKGKQALNAIKNAQVPRPRELDASIPEELEAIILKRLAKRPEDRFQTARDLHRALGQFFFELSSKEGKIFESGAMAALRGAGDPARPSATARHRRPPSRRAEEASHASTPRPSLGRNQERDKDQLLQPSERKQRGRRRGRAVGAAGRCGATWAKRARARRCSTFCA